jgi:hypothetical protein
MNRNALIEVLESTFSSDVQKEQARAALYLLDNPDRVTPIDLVPPADPGKLADFEWLSGLSTVHDEKTWIAGADLWLKSVLENPNFSADLKIEAQARYDVHTKPASQRFAEADAITAARLADRDARYARIRLEHPGWNEVQVHNSDLDHAGSVGPIPAPTVSVPTQNERTTNQQIQQLLSDDHRLLGFVPNRSEPAASPADPKSDIELLLENERAALDLRDAAASRRWNRAMNLSPAFQPGGFKGDD